MIKINDLTVFRVIDEHVIDTKHKKQQTTQGTKKINRYKDEQDR